MLQIRPIENKDITEIVEGFLAINWNKPDSLFKKYIQEFENKERFIWGAYLNDEFTGYCTLKIHSSYDSFREQNIPEIMDLNVLPNFRNQGIGTQLISYIESFALKEGFSKIGLGVGLSPDYGAAQKLYVEKGYLPDTKGITYKYEYVHFGLLYSFYSTFY